MNIPQIGSPIGHFPSDFDVLLTKTQVEEKAGFGGDWVAFSLMMLIGVVLDIRLKLRLDIKRRSD